MRIVWLHGLEGSPYGHKATELRLRGLDLLAPDGRGKPLKDRITRADWHLDRYQPVVLVGSSYGGLAAAWIATQRPLAGLVLLAPALHHSEPPFGDPATLVIPAETPTIVLHGTEDSIVPIQVSRDLAARCPHVALREQDDGHPLSGSLDAIAAAVRERIGGFACFEGVLARQTPDGVVLTTTDATLALGPGDTLGCQLYPFIGGVGMVPRILTLHRADGTELELVNYDIDDDQAPDESTATGRALEGFVDAVNTAHGVRQ